MLEGVMGLSGPAVADLMLGNVLETALSYVLVILGFSLVIFVHELGHFLAAKGCGVRVDRFAVGFGRALLSFRKGLGLRLGSSEEEYIRRLTEHAERTRKKEPGVREKASATDAEFEQAARELNLGETEYRFNWLPLGGYVKMQGQEDFEIDKSGEIEVKEDPRSFLNKSVGRRMIIVSSGVVMNAVFAAILFMIVFMVGKLAIPPIVGTVMPGRPADRAGLLPGDRIVEVNGERIADFENLQMATVLADPNRPMSITIERREAGGGNVVKRSIEIQPSMDDDLGVLVLGIQSAGNNVVAGVRPDPALSPEEQPEVGDEIVESGDRKISNSQDILAAVRREKGRYATLVVRRKLADGSVVNRQVKARAYRRLKPSGEERGGSPDLLGLVPRARITGVEPNGRADLGGLKSGDVVLRWGEQRNPTAGEIQDCVAASGERDIRVEVLRQDGPRPGQTVRLVVRPKESRLGRGRPLVRMGMDVDMEGPPVVAEIVTQLREGLPTAAAVLRDVMPRGSLIVKVNGEPAASWSDVIDLFFKLAGSDIQLAWRSPDGREQTGAMHVPATMGTVFPMPGDHLIVRINDLRTAEGKIAGQRLRIPVDIWLGASKALEACVGQTVEIEHRGIQDSEVRTAKVTVTREMLDTWPMRIMYDATGIDTYAMKEKFREPNPVKAMMVGIRQTYYFIEMVYLIIQRMVVDRSVGFEAVSGPIGIVKAGSDIAQQDYGKLLYFLALISANLAVINFLPLPIFDGGLMVFLLIEKIKGGPIPLKVQVVTQLVGLALIITIFLYVTLQDIQRIFG